MICEKCGAFRYHIGWDCDCSGGTRRDLSGSNKTTEIDIESAYIKLRAKCLKYEKVLREILGEDDDTGCMCHLSNCHHDKARAALDKPPPRMFHGNI